jgi:hypothetical protein
VLSKIFADIKIAWGGLYLSSPGLPWLVKLPAGARRQPPRHEQSQKNKRRAGLELRPENPLNHGEEQFAFRKPAAAYV